MTRVAASSIVACRRHTGRGDTEHRRADDGPPLSERRRGRGGHRGDGRAGIGQDLSGDAVESGEVGDRVHHRDVARAHVGPRVARGDRRGEQLRNSDREPCHRRSHDGRASGASQPGYAVQPALRAEAFDDTGCAATHRLYRRSAVPPLGQCSEVCARRDGNLLSCDVRNEKRLAEDACVHDDDVDARLRHAVAQVRVLVAFRVERPQKDDRGAASNASLLVDGRRYTSARHVPSELVRRRARRG